MRHRTKSLRVLISSAQQDLEVPTLPPIHPSSILFNPTKRVSDYLVFPAMNSTRSLLLIFSSLLFFCVVAAAGSVLKILPETPTFIRLRTSDHHRNVRTEEDGLFCESWRLAVETNNAGPWVEIPARCVYFVAAYMNGSRYASDSEAVARYSLEHAQGVNITGDGKDIWIFDIDDTLLSMWPFFSTYTDGGLNETAFVEWLLSAAAPVLPASLPLYEELRELGFGLVLITGRPEMLREATVANLLGAGYSRWERLILRAASEETLTAVDYKSGRRKKLEEEGYRIHGCSGDQWSDLLGDPMATRSFKLPNPMYYVP
ncbi:hypothetical protein ACLOJK_040093 [Asimina triloba]